MSDIHAFYIPFFTIRARRVWTRGSNDTVLEVTANSGSMSMYMIDIGYEETYLLIRQAPQAENC
jgi:hypothetical protein